MLHTRRMLPLVTLMGITMATAWAGLAEPTDYQKQQNALAQQLERLRDATVSEADSAAPALSAKPRAAALNQATDGLHVRKSALVASSLRSLITAQDGEALVKQENVASSQNLAAVPMPDILLPQFDAASVFHAVDDAAGDLDPAAEPAEEQAAASEEESADLVMPPLPPGPRVQATPQVREANTSLVTQLRALMQAVSVGAEEHGDTSPGAGVMPPSAPASVMDAPGAEVVQVAEAPLPPSRPARPKYSGNPLDELIDLDFRDVDLTHVVAILALKADINIVAGADLRGMVTANLRQVPLRVAIETVLRMNGLGIVEEDGIYFIIPYEEAAAVNRKTVMVTLENAQANDVQRVLSDMIGGIRDEAVINISANRSTNVLVISAPKTRVDELVAMAHQLDVSKPVLPTITEAISLNYAEPQDMMPLVQDMLTEKIGQVAGDARARHLVVTDMPVVVEQVKELIKKLDIPTKQVLIETMVVDAVLSDEADTGVQWLIDSVRRMSRRQAALGEDGRAVGNLQNLSLLADLEALQNPGSVLGFSVLTDRIDWRGLVQMEVRNRNGRLLSNPVLLTVENEAAQISISQEIPYIELTQTAAGGQQTSTRFKDVGTVLSVTPRVTHDNTIICSIDGKESTTSGTFQGIPIEDKREIQSTMRMGSGQTIFIGGLRKSDSSSSVKKIPVLGDVPIVNFMFRSNQRNEQINELLVFLTCTVIEADYPKLTPHQQEVVDMAPPIVPRVDAWETVMHDTAHPHDTKEPAYRWRRGT